jgi:DNA-binding NarL/FixJ family response regulator
VIAFCVPSHTSPTATRTSLQGAALDISPAQQRVLQALCRPLGEQRYAAPASNRDIADELFLSVETVKGTLGRLFELFGLESLPQNQKRAALAAEAVERGIVRRGDD